MALKHSLKKNINFILNVQEKVAIKTDKYRLSQTVYNVLTNAYKFTKINGNRYRILRG
jgi:two-component system, OmpR family, sensor histidine kinase BaeS